MTTHKPLPNKKERGLCVESIVQSRVQIPVGPAPIIITVSSSVISEMRIAQKPVAKTSPTKRAALDM